MNGRVHAATFVNRAGFRLFGIVHEPVINKRQDVAILLLSPGVKNRVAPHRLYNKMSALFTEMGFAVARFDFHGLGDSEGSIEERQLADLYGSIQLGRYVEDTRAAMDWMQQTHGYKRFILAGLCGGALTGLLASISEPRAVGLLSIGIPVMLDGSSIDTKRFMTAGQLGGLRAAYFKKALNPHSWARLLRLETDFTLMAHTFLAALRRRARASSPQAAEPAPDNTNPLFAPALLGFLKSGRPMLLLFSGQDRLYWEFEEKFLARHPGALERHAALAHVEILPEANHVLTFPEWQADTLQRSRRWLDGCFPRPTDALEGAVESADALSP
jgi:hypothetical protein